MNSRRFNRPNCIAPLPARVAFAGYRIGEDWVKTRIRRLGLMSASAACRGACRHWSFVLCQGGGAEEDRLGPLTRGRARSATLGRSPGTATAEDLRPLPAASCWWPLAH